MKNAFFAASATLFFFMIHISAGAQRVATWKGGTPGRTNDWALASNWKEGRVPDGFSDVVIADVSSTGGFQPVIRIAVEGINSLTILPGARLRIETSGSLDVFEPLEIIAGSSILNYGLLNVPLSETTRKEQDTTFAAKR